jgi:RNA polymerase sigma-70 factor (ECF subfamily)
MLTIEKLRRREIEEPRRVVSFALGAARMTARNMRRAGDRWRASVDAAAAAKLPAVDPPEPLDTDRLRECLAGLAERERSVVVLTFYDLRTSRQVGDQLGVSEGNVRVIRSRALGRLRDCMQVGGGEDQR